MTRAGIGVLVSVGSLLAGCTAHGGPLPFALAECGLHYLENSPDSEFYEVADLTQGDLGRTRALAAELRETLRVDDSAVHALDVKGGPVLSVYGRRGLHRAVASRLAAKRAEAGIAPSKAPPS